MTYRYLEHTADVGVEVLAPSLRDAFAEAGVALFGIMTDVTKFSPKSSVEISVSGHDLKSLLYEWLEELIYLFDTSEMVIVRIDVQKLQDDPPSIEGLGWGERFDPSRCPGGTEVKAITYHRMEVETSEKGALIRYFVDI